MEIPEEAARQRQLARLDVGDVRRLLDLVLGTTWDVAFNLVARLGLRRSEVLGMRWGDIDFDAATLTVGRGLHRVRDAEGSRLDFLPPKSATSARTISIGGPVLTVLRAQRKAQAERRLFVGAGWRDLGLILTTALAARSIPTA